MGYEVEEIMYSPFIPCEVTTNFQHLSHRKIGNPKPQKPQKSQRPQFQENLPEIEEKLKLVTEKLVDDIWGRRETQERLIRQTSAENEKLIKQKQQLDKTNHTLQHKTARQEKELEKLRSQVELLKQEKELEKLRAKLTKTRTREFFNNGSRVIELD